MPLHASSTIDGTFTWTTQCTDCHDSHWQAQMLWGGIDDNVYLVKAKYGATYNYNSTDDSTTLSYFNALLQPGWDDPATWSDKDGKGKGLTLRADFNEPVGAYSRAYEVIGATKDGTNAGTITVRGYMPQFVKGQEFGAIYGGYLHKQVRLASSGALKDFKYFNPKAPNGTVGGLVDTSGTTNPMGLCQVCHDNTNDWSADGSGNSHEATTNCLTCHTHQFGFGATPN